MYIQTELLFEQSLGNSSPSIIYNIRVSRRSVSTERNGENRSWLHGWGTRAFNKKEAVVKQTEEGDLVADLSAYGKSIVAVINDRLDRMTEENIEDLRR